MEQAYKDLLQKYNRLLEENKKLKAVLSLLKSEDNLFMPKKSIPTTPISAINKHKQMQCYAEDKKKELSRIKREITKSKNRIAEIDKLIQTAYESNVKGKITDERFEVLTRDYELEQHELRVTVTIRTVFFIG